jgi:hypothetical protein
MTIYKRYDTKYALLWFREAEFYLGKTAVHWLNPSLQAHYKQQELNLMNVVSSDGGGN